MAEVSLTQILDAREKRVQAQKELLQKYGCPVICFTMNIAGPIKKTPLIVRAFDYGIIQLEKALGNTIIHEKIVIYEDTGCEALFCASADAHTLKKICIDIEEGSALGRLFDMDVIDTDEKKLERENIRGCIVCRKAGRECAVSRAHSVAEIRSVTENIITHHFAELDAQYFAQTAVESLIMEVNTTPKPGLVDCANNGSHNDMNIDTFIQSAKSLNPYFEKCVRLGQQTQEKTAPEVFPLLKQAGIEAEKDMLAATNGVNTHKGIIYSMGIICGAIGRLWTADAPLKNTDSIFKESMKISQDAVKSDLLNAKGSTSGERLYIEKGIKGIRGEVASGFKSIKNISLPTYKKALYDGLSHNDSGVVSLLHLIANVKDTNLYSRGGEDGTIFAQEYVKRLLDKYQYPPKKEIEKADDEFIKRNLSPGGCADLLAITYFIYKIYNTKRSQ